MIRIFSNGRILDSGKENCCEQCRTLLNILYTVKIYPNITESRQSTTEPGLTKSTQQTQIKHVVTRQRKMT